MKIIVAGSRTFGGWDKYKRKYTNQRHITMLNDRLDLASSRRAEHGDQVVVISGTARGADDLGELWAQSRGAQVIRKPADWDRYGRSAGYRRNEEMAEIADACIIFWDGTSRGSMHMRDICHRLGIPCEVVRF